MVIVQVAGGLGNQLQQYALYRKLIRLGKEARLDLSWFQNLDEKRKLVQLPEGNLNLNILTGWFMRNVLRKKERD